MNRWEQTATVIELDRLDQLLAERGLEGYELINFSLVPFQPHGKLADPRKPMPMGVLCVFKRPIPGWFTSKMAEKEAPDDGQREGV